MVVKTSVPLSVRSNTTIPEERLPLPGEIVMVCVVPVLSEVMSYFNVGESKFGSKSKIKCLAFAVKFTV